VDRHRHHAAITTPPKIVHVGPGVYAQIPAQGTSVWVIVLIVVGALVLLALLGCCSRSGAVGGIPDRPHQRPPVSRRRRARDPNQRGRRENRLSPKTTS